MTHLIIPCSRIGHDNKGGGAAWFLDKVVIECPSLGRNWTFPANRWLAKDKEDNLLEVELFPQDLATQEYMKCRCQVARHAGVHEM